MKEDGGQASILRRLADVPVKHAGKAHVVELLDCYESNALNGRHQCLVTEALGPTLHQHEHLSSESLSPESAWEVAKAARRHCRTNQKTTESAK